MADKRPFAVVTGGTNGIGLELAKLFLPDGFDILIAGEDDAHSDTARQQLSKQDGDVQVWKGDLGRLQQGVVLWPRPARLSTSRRFEADR